jgi:hypothetical protein
MTARAVRLWREAWRSDESWSKRAVSVRKRKEVEELLCRQGRTQDADGAAHRDRGSGRRRGDRNRSRVDWRSWRELDTAAASRGCRRVSQQNAASRSGAGWESMVGRSRSLARHRAGYPGVLADQNRAEQRSGLDSLYDHAVSCERAGGRSDSSAGRAAARKSLVSRARALARRPATVEATLPDRGKEPDTILREGAPHDLSLWHRWRQRSAPQTSRAKRWARRPGRFII